MDDLHEWIENHPDAIPSPNLNDTIYMKKNENLFYLKTNSNICTKASD